MLAKAFAGQIEPLDFSALTRPSRQHGVAAAFRREMSAADGTDRMRLVLSALAARFEVPETFTPGRVRLTPPDAGLVSLPPGAGLRLSIWWAKETYLNLADIAAVSHRADFWSGISASASGQRKVSVGQAELTLSASFTRIGRIALDADAWAQQHIDIPVQDVAGLYGTVILTAWLNLDNVVNVPSGEVWGIGTMDVAEDGIENPEAAWRPSISLVE